ncbi:hypothetical protein JW710_01715 [Candidatus Dojkabacteria bacterium]|nr:hypothetical protein [Candidatus Dojkabacteria bacterium]
MYDEKPFSLDQFTTQEVENGIKACGNDGPRYVSSVRDGIETGDMQDIEPEPIAKALFSVANLDVYNPTTVTARNLFLDFLGGDMPEEAETFSEHLLDRSVYLASSLVIDTLGDPDVRARAASVSVDAIKEQRYTSEETLYVLADALLTASRSRGGMPFSIIASYLVAELCCGKHKLSCSDNMRDIIMTGVIDTYAAWIKADSYNRGNHINDLEMGLGEKVFNQRQEERIRELIDVYRSPGA